MAMRTVEAVPSRDGQHPLLHLLQVWMVVVGFLLPEAELPVFLLVLAPSAAALPLTLLIIDPGDGGS